MAEKRAAPRDIPRHALNSMENRWFFVRSRIRFIAKNDNEIGKMIENEIGLIINSSGHESGWIDRSTAYADISPPDFENVVFKPPTKWMV